MNQERLEVFLELYRKEPPVYIQELERQAQADGVPIIRRGTRDVLRYLLRTRRPKRVLEVGTAVGYSALFMKECLPAETCITTVEKVEMRLREARKNLKKYDTEGRIRLVEGEAAAVLAQMAASGSQYGFIFLDAAKGQYPSMLPDILSLLEPGGILVSDNIFHGGDVLESRYAVTRRDRTIHTRMREYLSMLSDCPELESICLPVGDGMTISTKRDH